MNKRKLFFVVTTVVLLIAAACEGGFVDPGTQEYMNGNGTGSTVGGGSGDGGDWSSGGGSGGGGGGGSNVDWVGTWTMVQNTNGIIYNPPPSFTLYADKSWTINNAPMSPSTSGREWKIGELFGNPAIVLIDNKGSDYLCYTIINSTKIKIEGLSFALPNAYGGTYTKR